MTCEHDWELWAAKMTGWYIAGDTPEFSGTYRAVCSKCGATHEGDWDGTHPTFRLKVMTNDLRTRLGIEARGCLPL